MTVKVTGDFASLQVRLPTTFASSLPDVKGFPIHLCQFAPKSFNSCLMVHWFNTAMNLHVDRPSF